MAQDLATRDDSLAAALVEAAPDAILVIDSEGAITLANRMAARLFGFTRRELVGLTIEMLVPHEVRERHREFRAGYQRAPRARPMGTGMLLHGLKKDGAIFPVEISLSPVRTREGVYTVAIVRDVSQRRAYEEELVRIGTSDALTGLHNRAFFDAAVARLSASPHPIGVVSIDVDGLKRVNDQLGHASGDELLRRVACVLRSSFRSDDVLARVGGDEFVALLVDVTAPRLAKLVVGLRQELDRENAESSEPPVVLEFSVGTACAESGAGLADAIHEADAKMYEDKRERCAGRDAKPRSSET